MSLLFRYIFLRHARLLMLIMGLGMGLYLLTDIVERVDIFIDAGSGIGLILQYFGVRLPSIMAQILPAVFLLATVVTLCLMGHFFQSRILGFSEHLFVGTRTTSEKVAQTGHKITDCIGSDNGFTRHYSIIGNNLLAFNRRCGSQ